MKYSIVTDIDFLRQPCEDVSIEEGEEIAKILWKVLAKHGDGIGLAANQIGIQKNVCVVSIRELEPVVLINPKIIEMDNPIVFPYDGCLSFPGVEITTQRHTWCTIETDNIGTVMFGPTGIDEVTFKDPQLWESIAVQHEIDHGLGIVMFDREIKKTPVKREKKYGRNEKINIKNPTTKEVIEQIKYKKAENYLKKDWIIIE